MGQFDFYNRRPAMIGSSNFRQYAVLAALIETTQGSAFLFEKRSEKLNRQPGEICFPGGRIEAGEKPVVGAVREATEELLLHRKQVELIGPGDVFISPFNFMIHPFLARLWDYKHSYNIEEVSEVFTVPLRFFQENKPQKYFNRLVLELPEDFPYESIPGGGNYRFGKGTYEINFYQYEDKIIWGMTAIIIQSMVELIDQYQLL